MPNTQVKVERIIIDLKVAAITLQDPRLMQSIHELEEFIRAIREEMK